MKFRNTSWAVAVLILSASLTVSLPAQAAGCALDGSGTEVAPWKVGSLDDFRLIGDGDCLKSGYYKQTASFNLTDPSLDIVPTFSGVTSTWFSGTYDGDFYTLTLTDKWSDGTFADVSGVFGASVSGTLKKLRLAGNYKTTSSWGQPLVLNVTSGGLISQVSSDVNVTVTGNSDTVKLSGLVQRLGRGAVMEYSRASGSLSWEGTSVDRYQYYGGLAVEAGNDQDNLGLVDPRSTEIRDSYSSVTVKWPSFARCKAYFGGIIGSQPTISADVYLVRSYSASSVDGSTDVSSTGCAITTFPAIGGLVGRSDATKSIDNAQTVRSYLYLVSSFWAKDLLLNVSDSVGFPESGSTNQYVDGLPRGVGLNSSALRVISTYQSRESATTVGIPAASSDLAVGDSSGGYTLDGTLNTNEETYRWAIEPGDQQVFVPQSYTNSRNFFTRTLLPDVSVPISMTGRGGQVLEGPVTNYPTLGRIWEMCSSQNNGFPVLVWEERTCVGGSSGPTDPDDSASDADGGEEILAQSPELAATGAAGGSLGATAVAGSMFTFGLAMLWMRRRLTGNRART